MIESRPTEDAGAASPAALRVRVHLGRLMGERKLRIADVARTTGISRHVLSRLYHEDAERIDLSDVVTLCSYFSCQVSDLLECSTDGPPEAPVNHSNPEAAAASDDRP